MRQKNNKEAARSSATPAAPIMESLLPVHSATNPNWVADAAGTAAERGLGALYCLLYLTDAAGQLVGRRPASSERMRALVKVHQALDTDLVALKFSPRACPAVASVLDEGRAVAVPELTQALPLSGEEERLQAAQRSLGINSVWLAPLDWSGECVGLLALFMPANPPGSLAQAELLGRHVAVALSNLREKEASRKRGELDETRWVYDEQRFLEQLTQEIRRAQRHKRPLSVLLLRLLNLNELRTRYGRFLAEQLLYQLSRRLGDTMRDTDFLGAFREDGFSCILVEADQEGAERAQERLLESVQTTTLPDADLPDLLLQLTAATATLQEDGETAEELTAIAEARLGQATATRAEVA